MPIRVVTGSAMYIINDPAITLVPRNRVKKIQLGAPDYFSVGGVHGLGRKIV